MPPLHGVVLFNHTGCICNVAGGRLPPLRIRREVVPFIRTGYIHSVPGTAHRPFPTVALVGVFLNKYISKTGTSVAPIIVNCQLSIVNSEKTVNCQLFPAPWPRYCSHTYGPSSWVRLKAWRMPVQMRRSLALRMGEVKRSSFPGLAAHSKIRARSSAG